MYLTESTTTGAFNTNIEESTVTRAFRTTLIRTPDLFLGCTEALTTVQPTTKTSTQLLQKLYDQLIKSQNAC